MIELKNISYSYHKEKEIIKDLNINIRAGECILFCGKSGCGKTTIGRIINNLIPQFYENGYMSGDVWIDNQNTKNIEMYELSKWMGTVFQNPKTQFFHTNSNAEIVFGLENSGMEPETIRNRYDEAIKELNIEKLTDRNMFSMSGGEKQIIAFASVYAMNPKIYILDEPTANIDKKAILKIEEIIKKLKKMGHTVIIFEHRLYFLRDVVDRVFYVEKGVVDKEFSTDAFFNLDDKIRMNMGLRSLKIPSLKKFDHGYRNNRLLEIRNLSCQYGNKTIFKNLNLSVNAGDIVGIVGDNGVGKTTLVRCIAGLHTESKGTIQLDHETLNRKKRQNISSMVMQDVNYQLFKDSALEECCLGNNCTQKESDVVLRKLDLNDFKELHPMVLSGGQKQRLVIANAVLSDKKILIFDEPTSGLDYFGMIAVSKQLKKLSEKGHYIFLVSHDVEFINEVCTKIYELKNEPN
ncbi:MAG: ABC transporter ATP-binding protein [Eubacteriaceae bacterium]|nr:ABC transporter ATP-binding protein [Eubacteriaceae bacterium]